MKRLISTAFALASASVVTTISAQEDPQVTNTLLAEEPELTITLLVEEPEVEPTLVEEESAPTLPSLPTPPFPIDPGLPMIPDTPEVTTEEPEAEPDPGMEEPAAEPDLLIDDPEVTIGTEPAAPEPEIEESEVTTDVVEATPTMEDEEAEVTITVVEDDAVASTISTIPGLQVNGYTITWADDGWYQVQDAYDFTEVCRSGAVCTVDPGLYIVTNHTTGQRDENFVVRDLSGAPQTINVSGSTISWPDDGWYQVQRANDYFTVCEGGLQCDVPDGVYEVINHTTGQRYRGILVEASYIPEMQGDASAEDMPTDDLPVSDMPEEGMPTVGMPEDGMPEEGMPVVEMPEGGMPVVDMPMVDEPVAPSDELPPGFFPVPESAQLDESAPYLIETLAGYQFEQIHNYVATLAGVAMANATLETELPSSGDQSSGTDSSNNRVEYGCSGGGLLVRDETLANITDLSTKVNSVLVSWNFQDCRVQSDTDELLIGEHIVNGTLTTSFTASTDVDSAKVDQTLSFSEFSLTAPEDNSLRINAGVIVEIATLPNPGSTRNVEITEYAEVRGGSLLRSVSESSFQFITRSEEGGAVQSIEGFANGNVAGMVTQGENVMITTVEPLARTGVLSEEYADRRVPFTGQVLLESTDSSNVKIMAQPDAPDFNAPLLYDYTLTTAEGETLVVESQQLPTFGSAPTATPFY